MREWPNPNHNPNHNPNPNSNPNPNPKNHSRQVRNWTGPAT